MSGYNKVILLLDEKTLSVFCHISSDGLGNVKLKFLDEEREKEVTELLLEIKKTGFIQRTEHSENSNRIVEVNNVAYDGNLDQLLESLKSNNLLAFLVPDKLLNYFEEIYPDLDTDVRRELLPQLANLETETALELSEIIEDLRKIKKRS